MCVRVRKRLRVCVFVLMPLYVYGMFVVVIACCNSILQQAVLVWFMSYQFIDTLKGTME